MLRVGRRAIISFPNFAYWRVRALLALKGRMPRTPKLPFEWYNTPNIHLLTIRDFLTFCRERRIQVLTRLYLNRGIRTRHRTVRWLPNLRADEGLFVITRQAGASPLQDLKSSTQGEKYGSSVSGMSPSQDRMYRGQKGYPGPSGRGAP